MSAYLRLKKKSLQNLRGGNRIKIRLLIALNENKICVHASGWSRYAGTHRARRGWQIPRSWSSRYPIRQLCRVGTGN